MQIHSHKFSNCFCSQIFANYFCKIKNNQFLKREHFCILDKTFNEGSLEVNNVYNPFKHRICLSIGGKRRRNLGT